MTTPPTDSRPAPTARFCAIRHVARRIRCFPELERATLDTDGLDARDAAFARALDHAVARRWLTIEHLLATCLSRPLDEVEVKLRAVLMVGAAQLLFFDRVPAHAAIDEAVTIAKRYVRPGAAGFTNAVLRRLSRLAGTVADDDTDVDPQCALPLADGRVRQLTEPVLDADRWPRLAAQTGHALPLLRHWLTHLAPDAVEALARHSLVEAPIILNGATPTPPLRAHDDPGFAVLDDRAVDPESILDAHPEAWIQDPTSARAVAATAGLSPTCIIDLCAGKGTKTRQLAALHPDAEIITTDIDRRRADVLASTFRANDRVTAVPFDQIMSYRDRADLLVLDVPCTNTGVLARRVEAKYRFDGDSLQSLVALQRQIIADALPLRREDGFILYATCSIEPAENQEQWAWFEQWHRLRIRQSHATLPTGAPGAPMTSYRDGGGFALLEPHAAPN